MVITLEQARALDAIARHGTFARAADSLRKKHTAVLYSLRTLETQTGLALLDRTGYRTKLTPAGEQVLARCRQMLAAERDLEALCHEIRAGWEPRLGVVFDGIVPADAILAAVGEIARSKAPTRIHVTAEFLGGVESTFVRDEADLMISVLPPQSIALKAEALAPIRAYLVAHRDHPLVARAASVTDEDLRAHVLLMVRGSDPRLRLSTAAVDVPSTIHLNDFQSKKTAAVSGIGYGWLPEHLITKELRRGTLVRVRWKGGDSHVFRPHVYYRRDRAPGRAAAQVIAALTRKTPAE